MASLDYVVLGGCVVGLTTALELQSHFPTATVAIVARHLPGDKSVGYASPWLGAKWSSVATDDGIQESWDEITSHKFQDLADNVPEAGVRRMELRALFDCNIEDAGILIQETGKVWYEDIVGVLRPVGEGV